MSDEIRDDIPGTRGGMEGLIAAWRLRTLRQGQWSGAAVVAAGVLILKELDRDPDCLHKLNWRQLEELVAGAYEREGWPEVVLTPRSGDGGRDVIASKPGFGAVRIYDQIKAYSPGRKVSADEVRAVLGVLTQDQNVSKGVVTTTATFAPGVERELKELIPYRLELKDGPALAAWLSGLRGDARS